MPPSQPSIPYANYDQQRATDQSHLNLLSVFHYVVGGIIALFACMPLIHVALGIAMLTGSLPMNNNSGTPPPPGLDKAFGAIFVIVGALAVLTGWTTAVLNFVAARSLKNRTRRMFILIIAGLNCLFMPFGTVLGVFTFVVMLRPSVESEFRANQVVPAQSS